MTAKQTVLAEVMMLARWCFAVSLIAGSSAVCTQAQEKEVVKEIAFMMEAHDRYFRTLQSWEGVGNLKETFTLDKKALDIPNLKAEPVRVERLSKIRFAWDASLNYIRATSSCISPTKFAQTDSTTEITENLQINCLITPDGFYRFEPNLAFSDFKGYPEFGKVTRVIEKLSLDDFRRQRTYSYLFDPQTVFEIHGHRVDSRVRLLSDPTKKRLSSISTSDSNITLTEKFRNPTGPEFKLEVVFDPRIGYLPVRSSGYLDEDLIELSEWDYKDTDGILLPVRHEVRKFRKGVLVSSRGVAITESNVNKKFTQNDFSLASIGITNGDRIINRETKEIFLLDNGNLKKLTESSPASLLPLWLILANIAAALLLYVAFRTRKSNA